MTNFFGIIIIVLVMIFVNAYGISVNVARVSDRVLGCYQNEEYFWTDMVMQIIAVVAVDMIAISKWVGVW